MQDIAVTWAGGSRLSDAVDTCLLIDDAASATRAVLAVLDALPLGSLPAASPVEEMFALALSRMQQVTDPATRAALIGELCQVAARGTRMCGTDCPPSSTTPVDYYCRWAARPPSMVPWLHWLSRPPRSLGTR